MNKPFLNALDSDLAASVKDAIQEHGYAIVEGILPLPDIATARSKLYSARDKILAEIGQEKLSRANEYGVLRLIMKFEPYFLTLLSNPYILSIVDAMVSATAVLHLQNGFILPSFPKEDSPAHFQSSLHRDFPRYLNGYLASINILLAIDGFNADNGGTIIVPRTHQMASAPDREQMSKDAFAVECPAGAAVVFDSTLWHASGINSSGKDRLAINHQFTRSFFKQQMDYVRALGDEILEQQPPRTQQLLGYYTRIPTSLDDYYKSEDERLYRKGQG